MPYFVSTVVVCSLAKEFLGYSGGITRLLCALGLEQQNWLANNRPPIFWVIWCLIEIWRGAGQGSIIYMVTIINTAIIAWNAWFEASIYVTGQRELWPLQLWVKQIVANNQEFLNYTNPDYDRYLIQYAVIIGATMPILIAMPFFQKRLQKGSLAGAIKE